MIQVLTNLKVADNTGATIAQCIRVLGGSRKRIGTVGDTVVLAIKKAGTKGKIKKGDVVKGVIIRVKSKIARSDGSYISSGDNAVVIVNDAGAPKGTRIFGPVAKELMNKDFSKIIALAPNLI